MKAIDMLNAAAGHMKQRASTYDQPDGERSMRRTVAAFNAVKGREVLTESDGWLLMELLKLAREQSRDTPHQDSLEDAVAYAALYGEARMAGARATEPAADAGGWIEWCNEETPLDDSWVRHTEGGCPVSPDTRVNVRLLGCVGFGIGEARDFRWSYDLPRRGVVTAYRIVRAAEPAADADGWIEWNGGECPVPAGTVVDVRLACGEEFTRLADCLNWGLVLGGRSITDYRIVRAEGAK